jgi:hypothetical protein
MAYTSVKDGVGGSANLFPLTEANKNFSTAYFNFLNNSGDVRDQYRRIKWTSTGGGEVYRIYAQTANAAAATGGTINGIHATLDMYSGAVSGTASAIRASLVSSASLTPGGTTSALFLSGGMGATNTLTDSCSFIHVNDTGAGTSIVDCFINFDTSITVASNDPTKMVSDHSDVACTHLIRLQHSGSTALWLMAADSHA